MTHFMKTAALGLVCVMGGCGEKLTQVPEPQSRPVKLQTVSVGTHDTFRHFPATLEAGDKAVLAFRVSGQLAEMDIKAGQRVKKGQKLASLNVDELSLLYEQAKANHQLAYVQFKRSSELRKTKVISELDYDAAKSALSEAKASLEQADANLGYATLSAPYDGSISLIWAENYEYVAAKTPILHIQSDSLLNITFQLPDYYVSRFKRGIDVQPVASLDTIPDQTFPAQFKEIDTEADPKTSSYKVTLVMTKPAGINIFPGMAGTVQISIPKASQAAIAKTALQEENGSLFVWRLNNDGTVQKVSVEIDQQGHVVQGLNDGDRIVISGVAELKEGDKVREWVKERGL